MNNFISLWYVGEILFFNNVSTYTMPFRKETKHNIIKNESEIFSYKIKYFL